MYFTRGLGKVRAAKWERKQKKQAALHDEYKFWLRYWRAWDAIYIRESFASFSREIGELFSNESLCAYMMNGRKQEEAQHLLRRLINTCGGCNKQKCLWLFLAWIKTCFSEYLCHLMRYFKRRNPRRIPETICFIASYLLLHRSIVSSKKCRKLNEFLSKSIYPATRWIWIFYEVLSYFSRHPRWEKIKISSM